MLFLAVSCGCLDGVNEGRENSISELSKSTNSNDVRATTNKVQTVVGPGSDASHGISAMLEPKRDWGRHDVMICGWLGDNCP